MKNKIAIIRGQFLTKYDMEPFELLSNKYDIRAFGSHSSFADEFSFPTTKLWSPVDVVNFPYKMPILNRLFIDAHYLFDLERRLKGFDIAHSAETYFHYTAQALNAKQKGYIKKVIVSVSENIPFNNEKIWGRKKMKKIALAEADHFVAITKGARDALIKEGVDSQKITVIGFGVNTNKFYPAKSKHASEVINILFVGRIEIFKGIFDTINAFYFVANKFPTLKLTLTIIGRGSKEGEMLSLIKKLGIEKNVIYRRLDYEEIANEYRKADIFIGPSKRDKYWMEQFGMVFLEAQASGLPIVSTMSGSIPETVGNAGILVEEGDTKDLILALSDLISNRNKRLYYSRLSRERAIKVHDIRSKAKETDKLYQRILR